MKKILSIIFISIIFSKFFGLIREIVISSLFGTSALSDAYVMAMVIPTTIFSFLGIALAT
jgi:putative peptidoglycan lipid II flippase